MVAGQKRNGNGKTKATNLKVAANGSEIHKQRHAATLKKALKRSPELEQAKKEKGDAKSKTFPKALSSLQQSMRSKLDSAKFRMLNETMYTSTGAEAKAMLDESPELFATYHAGYTRQVKRWPRNPLDDVIGYLRTQRRTLRVADLGCGEARLAHDAPQRNVASFDLVAANARVTACDIAHLPLEESSVDVVVFCLSLMGTNYGEFMKEARRILVPDGIVLVAEVASRFKGHDTTAFVSGVEALGFRVAKDHAFVKVAAGSKGKGRRKNRGGGKKKKQKVEEATETKSSAFFFKFAFCSTKRSTDDNSKTGKVDMLPRLNACIYKRR